MLLQSLRALCLAPGGSGSVWKYLEALVRLPGVSGRIAWGFRTELHFADEDAHLKIIRKTGSRKNKKQHAVGCEYIHIEAKGGQLTV